MDHVRVEVSLELLETRPLPAAEELVLDMAEDLLGGAVVYAVALPRHALDDAGVLQPGDPARILVLPAHIGMQDGMRAVGHPGDQLIEHVELLSHVRAHRRRPRHDLLAAEVVDRREVRLAPCLLELGHVRAHLLPGGVGREVAGEHVLEGLADDALVRAVPVVVGLPADAAADAHLVHYLEHGLVGDGRAVLRTQAHGDLAVPAAVGRSREDLGDPPPELGPGGPLGMRHRVVVAGPCEPRAFQQDIQRMVPRERRYHRGLDPVRSVSSALRASNFFR